MADLIPAGDSLYCVLYRSTARAEFNAALDLPGLTRRAQEHNAQHHITGMLLFTRGVFVQYVEGPRDAVLSLMTRISFDTRHSKCETLASHALARRHYGAWSMESFDLRETPASSVVRLENLTRASQNLDVAHRISEANTAEAPSEIALQLLAVFMTPPEIH
jgi:hypothetical protein